MDILGLAVVAYGILTLVLCFAQAALMGSTAGMLMSVVAAGLTYVFQAIYYDTRQLTPSLAALWAAIVISAIMSGVFPHVLR